MFRLKLTLDYGKVAVDEVSSTPFFRHFVVNELLKIQ